MNNIKYLLFDMDGVLVDSMSVHVESWKKAFLNFGLIVDSNELYNLGGVSFVDTINILAKKQNKEFNDKQKNEIHKLKIKYFNSSYKPKPYEGVYSNLIALKKKGFRIALVSGAIREVVDFLVKDYFEEIFEFTIASEDTNEGKPSPEPYLLAAKKFGANIKDCIVIEDSPSGILSGKAAKIKVLGIATSLPKEELKNADIVFENHNELFDFLLNL